MLTLPLLALIVALQTPRYPPSPPAPPGVPVEPMVVIGVQTFRGLNPSGSASSVQPGITDGYIYVNQTTCVTGGSDGIRWPAFEQAEVAWHVRGQIEDRWGDLFIVGVEWQRIWEHGTREENGRKGSLRLAVRMDERITLEQLVPDAPSACGVTEAQLETHVEMHPRFEKPSFGTAATGAAAARLSASAAASGPAQVAAQLWLVHTKPDDTEESQMIAMTAGQGSPNYSFNPVVVSTAAGPTTVRVQGFLRAERSAAMGNFLIAMIDRRVTTQSGDELRGATIKRVEMPSTSEVLSFEMPPLPATGQPVLTGHRFALRLKVLGSQ